MMNAERGMMNVRLLDLFCGAGGAAMGYHRSGFSEIVGVDIKPQKHYPFEFVQADALEFCRKYGRAFDVIHASPPCQAYSVTVSLSNGNHPDLVGPTREALRATGRPYVIENVPGAPLVNPVTLCGTMFPELRVIRHRLFECEPVIWWPPAPCCHWGKCPPRRLIGRNGKAMIHSFKHGLDFLTAMAIDWMTKPELAQAIPPAYTHWIGQQILSEIVAG
jgi:DNA (cytosine-5)-methyltransferase 1